MRSNGAERGPNMSTDGWKKQCNEEEFNRVEREAANWKPMNELLLIWKLAVLRIWGWTFSPEQESDSKMIDALFDKDVREKNAEGITVFHICHTFLKGEMERDREIFSSDLG